MATNRAETDEVVMNVRIERDLHEAVKAAAERDDRSVSSYVRHTLRRSVSLDRAEPA
jgi:predicted HicB family RNase H-like nuclease